MEINLCIRGIYRGKNKKDCQNFVKALRRKLVGTATIASENLLILDVKEVEKSRLLME